MFIVKEATLDDLEALVSLNESVQNIHSKEYPAIFKESPAQSDLLDFFQSLIDNDSSRIYIAIENKLPVGYISCNVIDRPSSTLTHAMVKIHIEHIAVRSSSRNQGVGRKLIEQINLLAKALGARHISLESWLFNENAIGFFKKVGFQPYSSLMWSATRS